MIELLTVAWIVSCVVAAVGLWHWNNHDDDGPDRRV